MLQEFGEATDKVHEQFHMKYDGVFGMSPWHSTQAEKSSSPEPPMAKVTLASCNALVLKHSIPYYTLTILVAYRM